MIKISTTKEVVKFGLGGRLNPRYVGPFEILERIREVAYRLVEKPIALEPLKI